MTAAGTRLTAVQLNIARAYGRGANFADITKLVPGTSEHEVHQVVSGLCRFNRQFARELARTGHIPAHALPADDRPAAEAPLVQAADLDELVPDTAPDEPPDEAPEAMPPAIPAETADAPAEDLPPVDHDEPTPAADRETDPAAKPLGQLLLSGRCWYCPTCISYRDRNRPCCNTPLIRARVTVRRDDADGQQ